MKVSLCCGVIPLQSPPDGVGSMELGLCPKCNEHTEFVDLLYKVCHEYGGEFITTRLREARECFHDYKKDGCDQIRLYEGLSTSDDADAIEWELKDYYDTEETVPLENYV